MSGYIKSGTTKFNLHYLSAQKQYCLSCRVVLQPARPRSADFLFDKVNGFAPFYT